MRHRCSRCLGSISEVGKLFRSPQDPSARGGIIEHLCRNCGGRARNVVYKRVVLNGQK